MYLRRIVLRKGYTTFLRFRYFIDFRCGIAIFADIFCGITVFVDIFCGIAVFGTPQCPPLLCLIYCHAIQLYKFAFKQANSEKTKTQQFARTDWKVCLIGFYGNEENR